MPSMKDQYCSSAMNDDDLQKVTVGKLKPHNAAINLVEYDTHWLHLFEREAKRIISALGGKGIAGGAHRAQPQCPDFVLIQSPL